MLKLIQLSIGLLMMGAISAHAAENIEIKDLMVSSLKSISATNSKEERIKRAKEFRTIVAKKSLDPKSSDDWTNLSVTLNRVMLKKASTKECNDALFGLLVDAEATEKSTKIESSSTWEQKEKIFRNMLGTTAKAGDISQDTFMAFQVLKAICE
ncbi:MAG: hypothetical protein ACM3MG_01395 [Bacillota bacterium]